MADLFTIGEFSHLAQVTVRTLRYYDECGVLPPAEVDRSTGYRYYALDQLPRLNRVLALKDLGFSLGQIGALLDRDLPAGELRGMLMLRRAELAEEVTEAQRRFARAETRLRRIEREGQPLPYDVVLKEEAPKRVVAARRVVPSVDDMPAHRCALFEAIYDGFADQADGGAPGTELALYHNASYVERDIDMELAVTVEKGSGGTQAYVEPVCVPEYAKHLSQSPPPVRACTLPGAEQMASVVHRGALPDVGRAITALFRWIRQNGLQPGGPYRQVNLFGREHDQRDVSDLVLEVQIPLEPLEAV